MSNHFAKWQPGEVLFDGLAELGLVTGPDEAAKAMLPSLRDWG